MSEQIDEVEDLLNRFRGVEFLEATFHEDDPPGWRIEFAAQCRYSIEILAALQKLGPFFIGLIYSDELLFELYVDDVDLSQFIEIADDVLVEGGRASEDMSSIEKYDSLNLLSQQKYMFYVKYLRKNYPDGYGIYNASELLEAQRICDCGNERYSKSEEMRAILEFNTPQRTFELLESIPCSNLED